VNSTSHSHQDPRELPNYGLPEAARYLRVPPSTLRAWALGMGTGFKPLFTLPRKAPPTMSFFNLVEAHVLGAIRQYVPMNKIRSALHYVEKDLGVKRPLINEVFQTDGVDLFVERSEKLLNASKPGQVAMRVMLKEYLERIEFDPSGLASRLYPFTREHGTSAPAPADPKAVVFDPRIGFGRLVIAGTGISTSAVAERFVAGDTIDDLVRDFQVDRRRVEEAIRCESLQAA
jgi:uncharacterized protein (DUF433 family)